MNQVISSSQQGTMSRGMSILLWTVQVLLAVVFLMVGVMKLSTPVDVLLAQMPIKMPGLFVRFIGLCEVAGALGLILPGLTRIRRELTPLAGWALALEMVVAAGYTLVGGGGLTALMPLILALICALVAYGRRGYASRA
ncbi:DoxX family protein [Ktedonosporobacter rubrisoli]|uniref:DoxX family protein n=1 Tax=Ktedonosporobacter rubrisoli TaxID=2509675 RepID=A0A4P6JIX1_KTERU|nr:DoxX family protein [Ktedonosporobacter rubrisoli]QBD75029.1 DoxX family protein [Ktedonosporobacter rubrisoli]